MAQKRFKSDAFEAVHSAASGMHRIKAIDKRTMREYDQLCITPPRNFEPKEIVSIRKSANVSQAVFAACLNTSTSTVQKWETGQKHPGGLAARLLQVVQKYGLEVLS